MRLEITIGGIKLVNIGKDEHPSESSTFSVSETSVQFLLQGQRKQCPSTWDTIGSWSTEKAARKDELEYREWQIEHKNTGWLDYRVVRETTIQDVLLNNASAPFGS